MQVRHRGTLGGALAANDPAGEYPAAALALDAVATTDRREIPAADLFDGAHRTVFAPSEIILSVRFAIPQSTAYHKILDPAARWPMVGVFVAQRTTTPDAFDELKEVPLPAVTDDDIPF